MATVPIPGALEMTRSDLMATIGPITEQYIPLYQRIGELSPAEREMTLRTRSPTPRLEPGDLPPLPW
jgi:hypothetical protein